MKEIQEIKARYSTARIENFGNYELVSVDKRDLDCLVETVEKLEREVRNYREISLERQARVGEYLKQNEQLQKEIESLRDENELRKEIMKDNGIVLRKDYYFN